MGRVSIVPQILRKLSLPREKTAKTHSCEGCLPEWVRRIALVQVRRAGIRGAGHVTVSNGDVPSLGEHQRGWLGRVGLSRRGANYQQTGFFFDHVRANVRGDAEGWLAVVSLSCRRHHRRSGFLQRHPLAVSPLFSSLCGGELVAPCFLVSSKAQQYDPRIVRSVTPNSVIHRTNEGSTP